MTTFLRAAFASVILLISAVAAGQTLDFTWTGDKNKSWDKADNWAVNGKVAAAVPGPGDNVTIHPVTRNAPQVDKPTVTVNNFTIHPNATLDMNGCTMTIMGTASFAGGRIFNSKKNAIGITITAKGSTATFAGTSFGNSATDAVNIAATCASIYLNGSYFYGTAALNKTGPATDLGNGGNTFDKAVIITNSGAGDLVLNQVNADRYNLDAAPAFVNTGTGTIRVAERAAGTHFAGNLTVAASAQSKGIFFGQQGGTATLAAGRILAIGTGGFTGGALRLKNFVQQGTTTQKFTLTEQAALYLETGTSFQSDVTGTAGELYLNGATFLGTATLTKTGAGDNDSEGGNVFGGVTIINQDGTGRLRLGVSRADAFNAALALTGTGTGALEPAYNHAHSFAHNMTIGKALTLGAGNATIYLTGANPQTVGGTAAASVTRLVVNKPANGVLLGTSLRVTETAALQSGVVTTSSDHPLIIADNATVTGASPKSFVSGPVQKMGDDPFVFPVGKGTAFRPVSLSAPNAADAFTAEYFATVPDAAGAGSLAGLRYRCNTDYWQVEGSKGAGTVQITLPLEPGTCPGRPLPQYLSILNYRDGRWVDEGGTVDAAGTAIVSNALSNCAGYFTLGQPFYVLVNASQVNATTYAVDGPGMTPVAGTSGANGTEQKIKPTAPAAGATDKFTIRIAPSAGNQQLDIEVVYDAQLLVKEVRAVSPAGSLPLAPDYYEVVDGFNLYFRKERRQAARLDLRTNLSNGLYYNQGAGKFEVSLPNPALFTRTQLHVYRLDHPRTKVAVANPPTANDLSWVAAGATPGVYQFELELEDRQGTKKTYQGQFILKP
ncbi:MAG: hypothetical protein AVDCRST_MAG56-1347 [uncultured Cytophagales bacterium]|uniref:G8 domain-containing protein n=1 Tax=uncultured Cytophagales bacterium TaxID=158755 RepID=A0A6J4HWX5_9SPHI|nr:MAG: hypothetical protein AVDCRST_MAG56-1347 [uncultured Cytophagales bacterium]